MDYLSLFLQRCLDNMRQVLLMPFDPHARIFLLYLAASVLFALFVFLGSRRARSDEASTFIRFLFPKSVWSHPSAWLDLRYFFFHRITGHFLVTGGGIVVTLLVLHLLTGSGRVPKADEVAVLTGWKGLGMSVGFMLVAIIVADFTSFYVHYLQHKIPVLWQFHKVHHSAEVMHPLSNYREHPIDNLAYNLATGAAYGVVLAIAVKTIGYLPETVSLLGVPLFMFLFNITGYNLRHSHVWLRWPGRWSMIFPSPAHHQVHHSCHPDHLDKNFAFLFPIWDVLFGCYIMPEDNRDVKFGVTQKDKGKELNSCLRLYFLPFRDAWRVLNRKRAKRKSTAAQEPQLKDTSTDPSTSDT
jgi:sterol desaturase/sphingolipid hydroxylase (fatty acid hydroxylase superfamily)